MANEKAKNDEFFAFLYLVTWDNKNFNAYATDDKIFRRCFYERVV